jgi:BirA family biotin operon repressor/biotin-[acetyl-CoA-carboxylase] ligase
MKVMQRIDVDITPSTMDDARQAIVHGAELPLVVVAREQTAGRGRLGRPWATPRGGVALTIAMPCPSPEISIGHVPLLAGLAVAQSIEEMCALEPERIKMKWPNDLLFDGCKVAGVLCERTISARAETPSTLFIGVGVNADFPASSLPEQIRFPATTLRTALDRSINAPALTEAIIHQIESRFASALASRDLVAALSPRLAMRNERISVALAGDNVISGTLLGLHDDASLRIATSQGETRLHSGEILSLRPDRIPESST